MNRGRLLEALKELIPEPVQKDETTTREVMDELGLSYSRARRLLERAAEKGLLAKRLTTNSSGEVNAYRLCHEEQKEKK